MSVLRMPEINDVKLSGRLTRDPEKSKTTDKKMCQFGIAVNRRYKPKEGDWKDDTSFFNVVVWGEGGERLITKLKKGDPVYIEGRLKSNSWEKEGKKHTSVDVIADRVQLLQKSEGANGTGVQPVSEEAGAEASDESVSF